MHLLHSYQTVQWVYRPSQTVVVISVISAAANLRVACAMKHGHTFIAASPPYEPNDSTTAGDMAIMILVLETAATVFAFTLVQHDLQTGGDTRSVGSAATAGSTFLCLPSARSPQGTKSLGTRLPSQASGGRFVSDGTAGQDPRRADSGGPGSGPFAFPSAARNGTMFSR